METIEIPREFIVNVNGQDKALKDPNPEFTASEVLEFYSTQYPDLTTASIKGPEIFADKRRYIFSTVVGQKG